MGLNSYACQFLTCGRMTVGKYSEERFMGRFSTPIPKAKSMSIMHTNGIHAFLTRKCSCSTAVLAPESVSLNHFADTAVSSSIVALREKKCQLWVGVLRVLRCWPTLRQMRENHP